MRKIVLSILIISVLFSGVSAEQTAPAPEDEVIMQELDEHWTEEVLPDIYDSIFSHFESGNTAVPTK